MSFKASRSNIAPTCGPQTEGTRPIHTSTRTSRPSMGTKLAVKATGLVAAGVLAIGAVGTPPASANAVAGGATFHSVVTCDGGNRGLEVQTSTDVNAGSYAMIYLYDYRTRTWVHENQWHSVSGVFGGWITNAFNLGGHGYYSVYMYYAQATSAGWRYSGEYISSYYQNSGYGWNVASSTCYL